MGHKFNLAIGTCLLLAASTAPGWAQQPAPVP
jgi:hypothetical protein